MSDVENSTLLKDEFEEEIEEAIMCSKMDLHLNGMLWESRNKDVLAELESKILTLLKEKKDE